MVTYQQLRDEKFRPDQQLRAIAAQWSKLWRCLEDRGDDLHAKAKGLADQWEGRAYAAAAGKLRGLHKEIDAAQAPLTRIDTELSALADDLAKARSMLLDAEADAARIPATISADGAEITYIGDDFRPHMRKSIEARIQKIFDALDDALDHANQADQAAAKTLAKLVPGYDPTAGDNGHVPKSEIPKPGTDPKKVNEWWNGLTPAEQQYLIHNHPDRVGGLDGVPVIYRDQANRVRLSREHDNADARKKGLLDRKRQLERDLAGAGANDMRARPARAELARINRELALVNNNLKGIKAIEDRLYSPEEGEPRAYLLKFEPGTTADVDGNGKPDDDGRGILAVGNPDTADHVATYVPGTGADIAGAEGAIDRADRMAYDANDADRRQNTAVILWLDYDAPDEVYPNAMSADYAEDAGDDLRRFQKGLRVTHEGAGSHNTVIGHSYGTTVIGHAAEDGPIHANDLIFVGSPGVGVDDATDLGVDPDHVWASRADGDPIGNAGGWHGGADPVADSFGGRDFKSDPGGHSDYWKGEEDRDWKGQVNGQEKNEARENMARIITGRYGAVTSPPEAIPPSPPHNHVDGKWN